MPSGQLHALKMDVDQQLDSTLLILLVFALCRSRVCRSAYWFLVLSSFSSNLSRLVMSCQYFYVRLDQVAQRTAAWQ